MFTGRMVCTEIGLVSQAWVGRASGEKLARFTTPHVLQNRDILEVAGVQPAAFVEEPGPGGSA